MLLLTRRVGEKIIINGNIIITNMGARGNQVRIGIDAPKDVIVHREEVCERIESELKDKETT